MNRDRYPQVLQFPDKVVDELVLCNDRRLKGFARRHGRRRVQSCSACSCVSLRALLKEFPAFST